jgi:hypothetical protein
MTDSWKVALEVADFDSVKAVVSKRAVALFQYVS